MRRLVKGTALTAQENDGNLDKIENGIAAAGGAAVASHVALADPHTQYALEASLGGAAQLNVGTTAGTVAAGNDARFASTAADIAAILIRLGKLQHENCIYVALSGNDATGTGAVDSPLRTVRAAALIAQPGDVVFIAPGTYVEPILPIRWKYDVTVFGSGLRSTIIQPAAGQEFNDIFKVDSGFWAWGVTFAGHQADESRQAWAIDFDELADNTARGAVGLGAFVLKSPYIQNCSSITAEDDAGLAGSASTGNTGGGIRVDGEKCAKNSPIRSMVVDSYTQVNLGGPGCLVQNDGYAQLVSFFGTFCTYHVRTESGGQVNLSGGGTTDFGVYGLMADGYSKKPLFTGSARIAAYGAARAEKTVTFNVTTDVFSCVAHGLVAGDQVVFSATQGSLPTGLTGNTVYFVIASGLTADAFKVSASVGGSSIDMSGSATGTYQFLRQGVTELDVIGFSANRLGRQVKYPSAGSLGSAGNPVSVTARGGATAGSTFTVTLATSTISHEYVGGGTVTVGGTAYPITSAVYTKSTGVTVLTASGYAPTVGDSVVLSGLSFICDSSSRPNAGQLMFPQLVFPRNAVTEVAEAKTFAYVRTGNYTLTYTEAASPSGPEHEYVSGGSATIGGVDYGVANAVYNKNTGVVTLTTKSVLPAGNGNVTVNGLVFICPTSAYIVTSSVSIDVNGTPVANDSPNRAGYRVVFYSGLNGGLKDAITAGQKLDFRNRSQVSAPSHTFEFVGSGTNYDALPWNGGVPVPANAIVETNNGRVYSSNTNEKGDFKVGSQFEVDGTTGSVTINTDQFNLSGLNFIGPFSRNGGISTVGEQLREVSNNTSLIASTGGADGNTTPTQFAVKTYVDNRFLTNVTVTAGLPLTISDTSTQDGQGYFTRTRNISLSVNEANGLARLDGGGLIPAAILPSYVDDVLEYANLAAFPVTGETGKIYVARDDNKTYRWSGSAYVEISASPGSTDAVPEGATNLYFTQARARQSISVSGSSGLSYDSGTGILTFTLPNTTVTAGTYTYASVTVDAQGRITSASSGTPPGPGTTDLGYDAATRLLTSSTGADVTLPLMASATAGLVPASGGGTTNFLRADGTFAAPPGGNTDLSYEAATRLLSSSTGADATLPLVGTTAAGLAPGTSFAAISYAASIELDIAVLNGQYRTIALTGNLTLTTTNRAAGRMVALRLDADGTDRALTFPAGWEFLSGRPSVLKANETAVLSLTFYGANDTDCIAAYAVTNSAITSASTLQLAGLGLGVAPVSGWEMVSGGGVCELRSVITVASGVYSVDVQSANNFVTSAAINGATTVNLSNLANIPTGYLWRGVLSFTYTSGVVSWFTGNTGYTVKWDGGSAPTLTANEVETVVISVVGGGNTIEVAALKGRA